MVSNEDVFGIGRVTTYLCIEVATAIAQSTIAYNLHHGLCQLEVIYGELVGIPAVLLIATVGIYATQHTIVYSYSQLVLKGVAG